jgi:hypothetical protein
LLSDRLMGRPCRDGWQREVTEPLRWLPWGYPTPPTRRILRQFGRFAAVRAEGSEVQILSPRPLFLRKSPHSVSLAARFRSPSRVTGGFKSDLILDDMITGGALVAMELWPCSRPERAPSANAPADHTGDWTMRSCRGAQGRTSPPSSRGRGERTAASQLPNPKAALRIISTH